MSSCSFLQLDNGFNSYCFALPHLANIVRYWRLAIICLVILGYALRYQPPIPAEEVKPAFDYEHEGFTLN